MIESARVAAGGVATAWAVRDMTPTRPRGGLSSSAATDERVSRAHTVYALTLTTAAMLLLVGVSAAEAGSPDSFLTNVGRDLAPVAVLIPVLWWFMRRDDAAARERREARQREYQLRTEEATAKKELAEALERLSRRLGGGPPKGTVGG